MTYSAPAHSESGFWQAELLDILFPRSPNLDPHHSFDAELLRQISFLPGLQEVLMTRQVHALEHATVWMLTNMTGLRSTRGQNSESFSGFSTEKGFYLYGNLATVDVSRATQIALRRITSGEWDLAVHPRCGTNFSVGILLTGGFALGATMFLPRDPLSQLFGVGMAAMVAAHLTPELGAFAQRYITTAIPFNLAIVNITQQGRGDNAAHFIEVRWVD